MNKLNLTGQLVRVADYAKSLGISTTKVNAGSSASISDSPVFDSYFLYPDPEVARLPSVRVLGGSFVTITPDNQILQDMSLLNWSQKAGASADFEDRIRSADIRAIPGRTMILGGQRNYYHWLLNWLSRAFILEQAGLIGQFDNILVNDNLASYQKELLSLVPSLSSKTLIHLADGECAEFTDAVCAPIFSNPIHSPQHIEWLRRSILGITAPVQAERIYISRRDAPMGRRQILNEDALFKLLRNAGYTEVVLSDYTVRQQAAIFSHAREVISPHGAGLTNCIFLRPDARICEIQAAQHYTRVFWSIGLLAKARRYDLIRCESVAKGPAYLQDLVVDLPEVQKMLDAWKAMGH